MFLSSAWVCTLIKYEPTSNVPEVSDHLLREDSDIIKNEQYAPLSPTSLGDWAINTTQSFHNYFTIAVGSLSHSIDGRGQRHFMATHMTEIQWVCCKTKSGFEVHK